MLLTVPLENTWKVVIKMRIGILLRIGKKRFTKKDFS